MGAKTPVRPNVSWTACALCGRNGLSRVLQSLMHCAATWSTVAIRSGSVFFSRNGSVSEM